MQTLEGKPHLSSDKWSMEVIRKQRKACWGFAPSCLHLRTSNRDHHSSLLGPQDWNWIVDT